MVQPVPRHSFVVRPIALPSGRELFELRLIAEPPAAALAAGKLDIIKLRAINRSPQDAGGEVQQLAFVESNRAFHRELAAATCNNRLCALLESLAD
ncbi:MAG: FCD domain-containing protein [Rhodobacter sp.]|nr:FCD domain-containing protein [Rhodobacter sp.]